MSNSAMIEPLQEAPNFIQNWAKLQSHGNIFALNIKKTIKTSEHTERNAASNKG
jgi:hypothetical protein